jgi:hypothetical protein
MESQRPQEMLSPFSRKEMKDVLPYCIFPMLGFEDKETLRLVSKQFRNAFSPFAMQMERLRAFEESVASSDGGEDKDLVLGVSFKIDLFLELLPENLLDYCFGQLLTEFPEFEGAILLLRHGFLSRNIWEYERELRKSMHQGDNGVLNAEEIVTQLQQDLQSRWRVEPLAIYLALCVIEWAVPEEFDVSFGCLKQHSRFWGEIPFSGVVQLGREQMQNHDHGEMSNLIERVGAPLLMLLHPIQHFSLAVKLLSSLCDEFESRFVSNLVFDKIGFIEGYLGGWYVTEVDGWKLRALSEEQRRRWNEKEIQNSSRQEKLLTEWREQNSRGIDYLPQTLEEVKSFLSFESQ